jgi:hypothetical protein
MVLPRSLWCVLATAAFPQGPPQEDRTDGLLVELRERYAHVAGRIEAMQGIGASGQNAYFAALQTIDVLMARDLARAPLLLVTPGSVCFQVERSPGGRPEVYTDCIRLASGSYVFSIKRAESAELFATLDELFGT